MIYYPDFESDCAICGTRPCVIVEDHSQPYTDLCGPCFFSDRMMVDWERWNDQQEPTE